jgi:hypothetical protein
MTVNAIGTFELRIRLSGKKDLVASTCFTVAASTSTCGRRKKLA